MTEQNPADLKIDTNEQVASIKRPYDDDVEFQRTLAQILTRVLTVEDKKLIANLIDQSRRVILHIDDLRALIAALKHIDPSTVHFDTRELVVTKCCKTRILPFKTITKCEILTADDRSILESYSISLDTVYEAPFESL